MSSSLFIPSAWRWWTWPVLKDAQVSQESCSSNDCILDEITSFTARYFFLSDFYLKVRMDHRKIEDLSPFFLAIDVFNQKNECIDQSRQFSISYPLFLQFSEENLPSQALLILRTQLCQRLDCKLFFAIDLIKGCLVILKKIKTTREKKFTDELMFHRDKVFQNHIHLISFYMEWIDDRLEKNFYIVQDYCPQKDLFSLIRQKKLPLWHRILLCYDVVSALYFLHQLSPWVYEEGNGKSYKVEKTAHLDVKLENYLVKQDERGIERAFLIDHELVGSRSNGGTLVYFDPQKMQLRHLISCRREKKWETMNKIEKWSLPFFKDFKDQKVRNSELNGKLHRFHMQYGQGHDIWALGLVLLSLVMNQSNEIHRFSSYSIDPTSCEPIIDQEMVDHHLSYLKKLLLSNIDGDSFFRWQLVMEKIFGLIRGALTIDYEKRIQVKSMKESLESLLIDEKWGIAKTLGIK